jgi:hypothetical protein
MSINVAEISRIIQAEVQAVGAPLNPRPSVHVA